MNNCIFDDRNNNSIGFYNDLFKGITEQGKELIGKGDFEGAETTCEILRELEKWREFDGLLVISENNGMGWTCDSYASYSKNNDYTV